MIKKILSLCLSFVLLTTMMSLTACTGKSTLKKADESIGDETGNNVTDFESDAESVAASSKVNSAAASSKKVTSKGVGEKMDNNEKSVPFIVSVQDKNYSEVSNHDVTKIVNSLEELEQLCEERYYKIYRDNGHSLTDYDEKHYYLRSITSKYGEAYFKDNALLLYLFTENEGGKFTRIDGLSKKEKMLFLNIADFISQEESDMMTHWSFVIELKKTDIYDVSDIKIISNGI